MLANAYINNNFYGLMDSIETNNNQNIIDFIWDNLQRGYYCTLQYNKYNTATMRYFSPDFFNVSTCDISECEIDVY